LSGLGGGAVAETLQDPLLVVEVLKLQQRLPQVFHRLERADPEEVLLEGPDEPLGAAVALRRPDEGGAGRALVFILLGLATGGRLTHNPLVVSQNPITIVFFGRKNTLEREAPAAASEAILKSINTSSTK